MKKFILAVFCLPLFLLQPTYAAKYQGAETVRVAEGDTLQSDLFAGSRTVNIDGVVLGDVFAGCETISIGGTVTEDVVVSCREVTVRGKVGDQLISFSRSLRVDGEVDGDVIAFSGEVRIGPQAHIKGNLYVGTGKLWIEGGRIDGNIQGGVGEVHLNGEVGKSVSLKTPEFTFGPDYNAGEGTKLTLPYKPDRSKIKNLPANLEIVIKPPKKFYRSSFFYWSLVAAFITGLVLVVFFKNFLYDYLTFARQRLWQNTGVGFLAFVAMPVAVLILLLLVLTIPLGLILLAVYFILMYLSFVFSALFFGDMILKGLQKNGRQGHLILPLLLGIVVVALVPELPAIGWLFDVIFICFGMGSLVAYIWNMRVKKAA